MHWQLTVNQVNVNTSEPLTINACLHEGRGTDALKKVTCRTCKEKIAAPATLLQAANLYWHHIERIQEKSDFHAALVCNACLEEFDAINAQYQDPQERIGRLMSFLTHCAYDHSLGAEPMLSAVWAPLSIYELNRAIGKPAATEYEAKWRASHASDVAQKV